MTRPSALLLTTLALGAITGCGVGAQTAAHPIDSGDLPSALLSSSAATVSSAAAQVPSSTIYLVQGDGLVSVRRPTSRTGDLAGLMTSLLQGPSTAESEHGLSTAINTDPVLNQVSVQGDTATVDLGSAFGDIRGQQEVLAAAQVVLTAVSFPGVSQVDITVDGAETDIPLADGTLTTAPLDRADYAPLLASSPAAASRESPGSSR
jgi:spore germination protein GerM